MIGRTLALVGAVLTLLSAVGVVRFGDVFSRMHALTKASTLGVLLVTIGAAFELPTVNDATSALLAGVLQLITLPIAVALMGRSTYSAPDVDNRIDTVDEYAEHRATERDPSA